MALYRSATFAACDGASGQVCQVFNGSGRVDRSSNDVTTVAVQCFNLSS